MKISEVALVNLLNRNNAMRIKPDRLVLGLPRECHDIRGANTLIDVTAVDDDPQYSGTMTFTYTRVKGSTLKNVCAVVDTKDQIAERVAEVLTTEFSLATDLFDFIQRTTVQLAPGIYSVTFDFTDHPLLFGYLVTQVTVLSEYPDLEDVIEQKLLPGFRCDQFPGCSDDLDLNDAIIQKLLPGFRCDQFPGCPDIPDLNVAIAVKLLPGFKREQFPDVPVGDIDLADIIKPDELDGFKPEHIPNT